MDLRTFVRESLLEIAGGVSDAQKEAKQYRSIINPPLVQESDPEKLKRFRTNRGISSDVVTEANLIPTAVGDAAEMIEFDIALTASESESKESEQEGGSKAGAKLYVVSADIGGKLKTSSQSEKLGTSVSRIKFRIPVVFSPGPGVKY